MTMLKPNKTPMSVSLLLLLIFDDDECTDENYYGRGTFMVIPHIIPRGSSNTSFRLKNVKDSPVKSANVSRVAMKIMKLSAFASPRMQSLMIDWMKTTGKFETPIRSL